ncbi:organic solute transporter Ostalpha-domain-containing protein, partial [Blyttiomyces helicus]
GAFALFATLASARLISLHLANYSQPATQKPITRVLLMVPIYSLSSWVAFKYYSAAVYLNVVRDCCKPVSGANPDWSPFLTTLHPGTRMRLAPPLCCISHDPFNRHFLSFCKLGITQYVIIRTSTTIAAVAMEYLGVYCHGSMSPHHGHFWLTVLNAGSVGVAMFSLATFYLTVRKVPSFSRRNPVLQFLSVKFVIFFGFWQGVVIKLLVYFEHLRPSPSWSYGQMAIATTSFLTCIEMAIASVLHIWAFSYTEYVMEDGGSMTFFEAAWDSFFFLDIFFDVLVVGRFL